jgi:ABC-2 type transport system permease protein
MTVAGTAGAVEPAAPRKVFVPEDHPGRYGPIELVKAEWTKLRTVRSTTRTLAVTIVAVIGIGAIATAVTAAHWKSGGFVGQVGFDPTQRSLAGLFLGQIAIGVLGVIAITAEYSTGTIRATLAATPSRPLVLACKAAVYGFVALVTSEIITFAAFLLGQQLLKGSAPYATLGEPGVLRAVVGAGLVLTVMGLFALGLGTIIRHTAGAISAYVAILLVVPLILQAFPTSVQHALLKYMPLLIAEHMATTVGNSADFGDAPLFTQWVGFGILCGYTAFLLIVGGFLFSRRDA